MSIRVFFASLNIASRSYVLPTSTYILTRVLSLFIIFTGLEDFTIPEHSQEVKHRDQLNVFDFSGNRV